MTSLSPDKPRFFLTAPAPCPYLPGREERKVFTHLVGRRAPELNAVLSQGGFRRSQKIAYRPACDACRACISVRVAVDEFQPGKSFRRVMERNGDIVGHALPNEPTSEQYSLFRRYLDDRHPDGGMVDMSVLDYAMMVEDSHVETAIVEYRRRGPDSGFTGRGVGPLLGAMLIDQLTDGLSLVYSFYDPDEKARSLGTFMILDGIARAKRLGVKWLYLGYWVDGSRKMAYKARFLPQERLMPAGWERFEG